MAIFTKPKHLFLFFLWFILISLFVACQSECEEEEEEENNNPYLHKSNTFKFRFKSKYGEFRVLDKFTQLLRGIEKYRVGVLKFEPLTFMLPNHFDAEVLLLIVRGRGTISIAEEDEKNSFNLEHGDVIRVSAGSTIYFTNTDNKEKLSVYVLTKGVNFPGKFQEFFSAGSENPESFCKAFSIDILETAFNTPRDRLERLFGQQKQGIIIKASEDQIRAISQLHVASRSTRGLFNLLKEPPLIANRFGQYIEASPEKFQQLKDLDVGIGIMNINQGGMILPVYNTRTTWLVMVAQGNGRFEMVGSQIQQRQGHNNQKAVRGCLSVGDFFVIPAGHPITVIATGDSNLSMVGFGINGNNSRLNFLAGQESIWRNVNREAKELSFNMPGGEVEEILQNQDESYFLAAPKEKRGQQYESSILNFVF